MIRADAVLRTLSHIAAIDLIAGGQYDTGHVPMPEGVFVRAGEVHKCRHFVYQDGQWRAYASKWKSQFRGPKYRPQYLAAVYAGGPTITAIQQGLAVVAERQRRQALKREFKKAQRSKK